MNNYLQLRERQQAEINNFGIKAAFSETQYNEMCAAWGLDPEAAQNEIIGIGGGCFILKRNKAAFVDLMRRHEAERKAAIKEDTTGDGYIFNMFYYEMANHEYIITGDLTDTLEACGVSFEDIEKSPALAHGLTKAQSEYYNNYD